MTDDRPDPHVVVLFGATGDLAARKLLPGLLHLEAVGLMPDDYRIIGTSRRERSDEELREHARDAVERFGEGDPEGEAWDRFSERLTFVASDADDMGALAEAVDAARQEVGAEAPVLIYLSIPPAAMGDIVAALGSSGLAARGAKVIMEKPFGTDLDSARALNGQVHDVFSEDQVFRIDHFLGKEDVQNILAVRFGNRLFEPLWCADHVESIQIDVPETLGVDDRVAFYEATGAFRDMVVTHLLQVLGFVAMEPPEAFSPEALAKAKQAVFASLAPLDPAQVVRGQYEGYRDLDGVAEGSETETLVALQVQIDNDRWSGVPILLRTGKQMPEGRRVITLRLRHAPLHLFPEDGDVRNEELVFELGEPGSIHVGFLAKEPGPTMALGPAELDFDYASAFDARCELEAYERLLHDALQGDRTLFNRAEGIERLWEVAAPLLDDPPALGTYAPGTWGPDGIDALAGPGGWHLPEQ